MLYHEKVFLHAKIAIMRVCDFSIQKL